VWVEKSRGTFEISPMAVDDADYRIINKCHQAPTQLRSTSANHPRSLNMAEALISALKKVQIGTEGQPDSDDWIDSILDEQRPRKRMKQEPEDLKLELEQKYLAPSTTFSNAWLNKLQQ
jgi:hypothetical protein